MSPELLGDALGHWARLTDLTLHPSDELARGQSGPLAHLMRGLLVRRAGLLDRPAALPYQPIKKGRILGRSHAINLGQDAIGAR